MRPGVDLVHRRRMHGAVGIKTAHETKVVDTLREMREQRGDFASALPVLLEFPRTLQQRRIALGELADDRAVARRQRLPVVLLERRLGIERVHLARRSHHEKEDHRFGFRRQLLRLRRKRIHALCCAVREHPAVMPARWSQNHSRPAPGRRGEYRLRYIDELVSIEKRQTEIRQSAAGAKKLLRELCLRFTWSARQREMPRGVDGAVAIFAAGFLQTRRERMRHFLHEFAS